ncbi:MAG: SRPBCC family protein [Bacteroidota bacterium]|nr:SRPBCC family protein [Bacteroidota bacterium]
MKPFLKKVGIWAGIILLAIILFSFLLPTEVTVERKITINAPMDRVFEQVNDLRNWEKWSPWKRMDPMMEMTFSNPPVGQGAFYKWVSKDKHLGTGTMTLAKVTNNEEIVTALHNEDWGDSNSTFAFGNKGKEVLLTWKMTNKVGVMPWSRYFALAMKSQLKKQFDKGLEGIKFYAEKS